jgi:hypothetical protein
VTDARYHSTQITSELVVPSGLVEQPPFPGNLEICSSNHGGGNLTTTTASSHLHGDPDVITQPQHSSHHATSSRSHIYYSQAFPLQPCSSFLLSWRSPLSCPSFPSCTPFFLSVGGKHVTDATQIISEQVVPSDLVEQPSFPGDLQFKPRRRQPNYYYYIVTSGDPDVIMQPCNLSTHLITQLHHGATSTTLKLTPFNHAAPSFLPAEPPLLPLLSELYTLLSLRRGEACDGCTISLNPDYQ